MPELIKMAHEVQDRALERVGHAPTVPVEHDVVQGHAATALLERAKDADLLVLGRGGHVGWIGSTSARCAAHAACDVVVVP